MGDPIVDSFLAGSSVPAPDPIAASFTAGYGKVKRYPGDPISKIEERRAHPPPNARGSAAPEDDGSAWDYAAAIAKGIGGIVPDITGAGTEPLALVRNAVETGRTAARYMGTPAGTAQAVVSAIPIVGAPLAAIAQPAKAYAAEGRPPTHEENVSAVESGTSLATMVALPAALRVANMLRARGGAVPETGPVEAPPEPATSAPSGPVEAMPAKGSPAAFPIAGERVSGLKVRSEIPNQSSISATFNDGEVTVLPGVREIPIEAFDPEYEPERTTRVSDLASEIKASREINPLIVAIDEKGPYILEGGHRYDALRSLGVKSIPAQVVMEDGANPNAFTGRSPNLPEFDEGAPGDEALVADASRRFGNLSPSEFFQKQIEADQLRRTPEAAIARAELPLDEFVKQRFPRATLTPERDAAWTQSVLSGAPDGSPGFSIEAAPDELRSQGIDRQLVYRDPDGKPIGVATLVDGEAGEAPLVRDFAVDKSQGLLSGRAVGAIATELDLAGAFEHMREISPDAARFVQKAEARRAAASTKGEPPKPTSGGGTSPSEPPPAAPSSGGAPPAPPPPAIQGAASQPTPDPPPLPPVDDPQYGAALRTRYTGSVDVRVLDGSRIRSWMMKALTPDEQNALSIMRDEKSQPGSTASLVDGTHPVYQEPGTSHAHVEAMSDVAELALNPTPAMQAADAVLDAYFTKTLKEGKEKGVIDSSIESSDYIPHLLQPAEGIEPGRTGSPGGISETTPFALKRKNPTILEAMARGLDPRTINAADAVAIYARRHGLAMAAQILEDTLKESGIGKAVTAGNAPAGWGEVGEGTRAFKRDVPYHDESGKLPDGSNHIAIAHQALYAPAKIVEALRPITEPNFMLKVPGWEKAQRFQDYIKSANVALAFFHLKAVTITAFNSMRLGPVDMMKAYMIGVDDPVFIEAERTLVQAGGKTSAVGQTAEAYRALEPTAIPSRVDAIRNLPVMRQLDAAAQATSKLTFDIALRKSKVMDFASKDAAWITQHPEATDVELAEARRSTARTLNANYGGLNWEALGITRGVHAIMRAFMFAPDWTWSNVESVTQAFRSGPGGAQARWYMARSIAAGMGATGAMTYFISGKLPGQVPGSMKDRLFNVYLGDDEKGNHKFVNLFFAGAPNDAVNLAANVIDYGAGKGVMMSAATKLNVLPRIGLHGASNKDFMGRDIVPPGAGPVLGTALSIESAAGEAAPVPFSVKNAAQMATDARREYSPAEYAAAMVAGVRPRHVVDHGGKVPITETKWVTEPPKNSAWDILTGSPVYRKQ